MKVSRFILSAACILFFAACNNDYSGSKEFIGIWHPVGYEDCDTFVITNDSIKAIQCVTEKEHYQCYYKMLSKRQAELKRCWLEEILKDNDAPESSDMAADISAEVTMYIDQDGCLIIRPFDVAGELEQVYPNYANLKLAKQN